MHEIIYTSTATLFKADYRPSVYRELYRDYCKHYGYKARVEGGWKFFEFLNDYLTWTRQI